ncbi:glutamyl-tRNA amidotransferase, partial [candidate division MSBL1 archaeon SCGC-AAA259E17]
GEMGGIRIREVHIEEDPGKYDPAGGKVDFNRSGIPLVEIITEPDLTSPEEARNFLRSIIRTLQYTGKVNPAPSTLRADTNISLEGGKRVEIKNINSVKGAYRAIKYEVMRQKRKKEVKRETRAYMESQMITVPMRDKEVAEDYRYIPDPDLLPIMIERAKVKEIREKMYESPHLRKQRIIESYGIEPSVAEVLVGEREFVDLFEKVAEEVDPEFASHWFKDVLRKVLNYMDIKPSEISFSSDQLVKLMKMIENDEITPEQGELVLREMAETPADPEELVEKLGLEEISREELNSAVQKTLTKNEEAVEDFKNGKGEALNFLAGQVMSATEGRADPREVMEILKDQIKE